MLEIDINVLWTIINLLILFVLLRVFLFKPVHNILEQRKADVDAQLKNAADTNAQADALKAQYAESIQKIDEEHARSIASAKAKAGEEYDRIVAEAGKKAESIVADAKEKAKLAADQERQLAENDIADMLKSAAHQQAASVKDSDLYDQFLAQAGQAKEEN
jgi:F-type H+-transporting ATPase subunit b